MDTPRHPNKHPSVNHTNSHTIFFCVRHSHTHSHSLHFWQTSQHHILWVCSHSPLILWRQQYEGVSENGKKKMFKANNDFFLLFPTLYFHLLSQSLFISFPFLVSHLSYSLHTHIRAFKRSTYTLKKISWNFIMRHRVESECEWKGERKSERARTFICMNRREQGVRKTEREDEWKSHDNTTNMKWADEYLELKGNMNK